MGNGIDGAGSARRNAHEKINRVCACGRRVNGNGRAHERSCTTNLAQRGWPLDKAMAAAIRDEYRIGSSDIIRSVERRLGADYLDRRAGGDLSEMSWAEYRDRVWRYADEVAP